MLMLQADLRKELRAKSIAVISKVNGSLSWFVATKVLAHLSCPRSP